MKRIVVVALILLAGCGKGNFSNRAHITRQVLIYPLSNRVTTLDPGKVKDVDMGELLRDVFEGLVAYNEQNELIPQLAESWRVADGGRTYVFTLRSDVKFHNGRPLEASDVKWSIERNLSPQLGSTVAIDYLSAIVGAKEFAEGKAKDVQGIQVPDPRTVKITLDKPRPYFLGDLTYPCAFVMAKEAAGPTEIKTAEQAVGTGPYRLTLARDDQELDLTAYASYYGKPAPATPKIQRPIVEDPSTQLTMYKNGDLDEVGLPRADLAGVSTDPDLKSQVHLQDRPALFYYQLNEHQYPPFKDVRVRQAFAMAIDREKIVNDLLTGYTPAKGILPPGMVGYQKDLVGIPFDPEKAKSLLVAAGYQDGSQMPPLEISFRAGAPDAQIAAVAVTDDLKNNLGIVATPHMYDFPTLLELQHHGKLEMSFASWYADYLDPQNFLSLLLTSGTPQNSEGYSNKRFDNLCARADVDMNPVRRIKLYQQAEDIAVEDVAKLPLYFQRDAVLISPRVQGIRSNLFGELPDNAVRMAQ